jgi:hypothetical protein
MRDDAKLGCRTDFDARARRSPSRGRLPALPPPTPCAWRSLPKTPVQSTALRLRDRRSTASWCRSDATGYSPKRVIPPIDAVSVGGIKASHVLAPGRLVPLGPDGLLPTAAIPPQALNPPLVYGSVGRSTRQTFPPQIAGGPVTFVVFDSTPVQVGGSFFDPARPTYLIVPQDGYYLITATVAWQPAADRATGGVNRALGLYVDDGPIAADQRPPADETIETLAVIQLLRAGDRVSEGPGHDNSTPLDIQPGASVSVFRLAPLASP